MIHWLGVNVCHCLITSNCYTDNYVSSMLCCITLYVLSSSKVISPKDAQLTEDAANNENVAAGKKALKNYISIAQSLCQDLQKDSQLDVRTRLKELGGADVRTNLNKFNEAFSEDTQRGTDRLIRVALQDITELKKDAVVKEGKTCVMHRNSYDIRTHRFLPTLFFSQVSNAQM